MMNDALTINPVAKDRQSEIPATGRRLGRAGAERPRVITPRELHERWGSADVRELLDVRTPGEYAAAHVPGARLLPLADLDAAAFLRQRGANNGPIYILCQTTRRARGAIQKFRRAGFDQCVLVAGGMQAWMEAGLPVNRSESKVLPLMRQVQIVVGFLSAAGAVLALTVHPLFAILPLCIGCGLMFAGATGVCGLALLLARMPWNRLGWRQPNTSCPAGR